jgi:hypothetical protein
MHAPLWIAVSAPDRPRPRTKRKPRGRDLRAPVWWFRYRARPLSLPRTPVLLEKVAVTDLLYFDGRTRVFKLLFDFCSLFLVDALFD